MANLARFVSGQSQKDKVRLVTGTLVSYNGSLATVNVQGQNLTLTMMDSVSSTIAIGSTVVCQVSKGAGFVIGSVNTVSRTQSAVWTGGFSNPPVPRPITTGLSYTNVSPTQIGAYEDISGTWSNGAGANMTQSTISAGAWFYGSSFTSLSGKNLQSLEIYLPPLASGSYPLNVGYLLVANRPASTGIPPFNAVARSTSGWVSLPSSFVTALSGSLNAFAVGLSLSSNTASINPALPYGTLRIGWSK